MGYKEKISDTLNKVNNCYKKFEERVEKVKGHAVLDTAARMAMKAIPIIGPVIEEWYNKVGDSDPTSLDQLSLLLKKMQNMSEEQFVFLAIKMEQNHDELVNNQGMILDQIIKSTKIMSGEIQINRKEILQNRELIIELLARSDTTLKEREEFFSILTNIESQLKQGFENVERKVEDVGKQVGNITKITLKSQDILKEVRNEIQKLQQIKTKHGITSQIYTIDEEVIKTSIREELSEQHSKITELIKGKDIQYFKESLPMDVDYALEEANAFFESGNYEIALELYKKIFEQHPKNCTVLLSLGYVLWKMGKIPDSLPYLNKINKIEKYDFSGLALKARIFLEDGKADLAEKLCDELLAEYATRSDVSSSISLFFTKTKIFIEKKMFVSVFRCIHDILDMVSDNKRQKYLRIIERQPLGEIYASVTKQERQLINAIIYHDSKFLSDIVYNQIIKIPKDEYPGLIDEFNEYQYITGKKLKDASYAKNDYFKSIFKVRDN